MTKHEQVFHFTNEFPLEGGRSLRGFDLKYTTAGQLNKDRNNVVWVCHALTGSSDFTSWWADLFTADSPLNPDRNFIICANMLGSCYGSTGALSVNPETRKNFFHSFPTITNRDAVRAFDLLRESLGISSIHTLIGGSLGGQQVLEWAILKPSLFEHVIPIACNASHSPWGIAFNEAQRMAIAADPSWKENDFRAGHEGLKAARAIGMISYRTYETFQKTQAEESDAIADNFKAATYQQYQGEKLANRFNAFAYWTLSKMMDSHNVARNRESIEVVLQRITARTLVIGIESDLLFPLHEQRFLAENIPGAQLAVIQSTYGHDGFLVEYPSLKKVLQKFYKTTEVLL